MEYKLTVIVPGIRTDNWKKLYRSVMDSFHDSFEIIFISPYCMPESMKQFTGCDHVRHIEDWGTPIRCQQRALVESRGAYITWAADDGVYMPGALDVAFKSLSKRNYTTLVMGKYHEGDANTPLMDSDGYYILNNHLASDCIYMPDKCWMLNVGVVSRKLLFEVGGWDCRFEVCPMAYNDLAIRLKRYYTEYIIQQGIMYKCTHTPGHEGDHAPIHDAQVDHDEPLFKEIYNHPTKSQRVIIDINNWKQSPERWERRFGK